MRIVIRNDETKKYNLTALAFQACVIANSVFGSDAELYVLSKIVMFLFFAVAALDIVLRRGKVTVGMTVLLPLTFIVYSVLSVLWSKYPDTAQSQLVTQLQLFVLLLFTYLVSLDEVTFKHYLDAVYIAGYGLLVFALVRYGGLGEYVKEMESGIRVGDEVANQNTFGMTFSYAGLAAAYYLIIRGKKIHLVSIGVFTFFALSSGSKKAALMIVAGILLICAMHYGIKRIYKTVLIGAVVLVVAWCVLQLPVFSTINQRLASFFSGEKEISDQNRLDMIEFGLTHFWDRPILGHGLQNFREMYKTKTYSHNNFVEVLFSLGLVGFVMYYAMFFVPAGKFLLGKSGIRTQKNEMLQMLLVFIAIEVVFGYGMVQMYEKGSHLLMGLSLGIFDRRNLEGKR